MIGTVHAQMAEWSIASDCKSDAFGLRRFKSYSAHQNKNIKHMPQKKIVKLKNKKTGETIYMHKSGKPGSSTMPKLKMKKYSKVTRKREVFEESKK